MKINSVAAEHTVVIIDADSRDLDTHLWAKAQINAKIMKQFWQWAKLGRRTEYRVGKQMERISLLAGVPKLGNGKMAIQPNSHYNAYFNE